MKSTACCTSAIFSSEIQDYIWSRPTTYSADTVKSIAGDDDTDIGARLHGILRKGSIRHYIRQLAGIVRESGAQQPFVELLCAYKSLFTYFAVMKQKNDKLEIRCGEQTELNGQNTQVRQ